MEMAPFQNTLVCKLANAQFIPHFIRDRLRRRVCGTQCVPCHRLRISPCKTIKKPPDTGGLNFWYSVLSEYRAKHPDDFKKLAVKIQFFL